MADNEQTVAREGATSANSKKCDMLFLAGMILVAAAYLLPFDCEIYLCNIILNGSNVSKGTIFHRFVLPPALGIIKTMIYMLSHARAFGITYAFYFTKTGGLQRIFSLVTIVSAIIGLGSELCYKK